MIQSPPSGIISCPTGKGKTCAFSIRYYKLIVSLTLTSRGVGWVVSTKGYVEWIYSTHFAEKTKPAVYYLGLNGVRYLRTLTRTSKGEDGSAVVSPPIRQRNSESATKSRHAAKRTLTAASLSRSVVLRLSGQILKMRPQTRKYIITTKQKQITYLIAAITISFSKVSLSNQVLCSVKTSSTTRVKKKQHLKATYLKSSIRHSRVTA